MGLEFTGRPDRQGPALYVIDKNVTEDERLVALATAVDTATNEDTQVVYLRMQSPEGQAVTNFYAITQFPAVLIVMDDDQIYQDWYYSLPTADEVVLSMGRAGARLRGDQ